jgi:hypothetical protein
MSEESMWALAASRRYDRILIDNAYSPRVPFACFIDADGLGANGRAASMYRYRWAKVSSKQLILPQRQYRRAGSFSNLVRIVHVDGGRARLEVQRAGSEDWRQVACPPGCAVMDERRALVSGGVPSGSGGAESSGVSLAVLPRGR